LRNNISEIEKIFSDYENNDKINTKKRKMEIEIEGKNEIKK
jgi:hypothetical protein